MARVTWYPSAINAITTTIPQRAHGVAVAQSAQAAAAAASRRSGQLAADVSQPKAIGFMRSGVGSSLIYAGVQDRGAVITAKNSERLLIKDASGKVVASAKSVRIPAKHYRDRAREVFPKVFIDELRRSMPQ
jgi:hypothetical protein